jgi:hypothetical protein
MDSRALRTAAEQLSKHHVQALGDGHRQPNLITGRTHLNRHVEDYSGTPTALGQTGTAIGTTFSPVECAQRVMATSP